MLGIGVTRKARDEIHIGVCRSTDQSTKVTWLSQARWVEDGKYFTSSGVSAGTDMARGVIAKLYGRPRAEQVAMMTEYEWQSDSTRDPFSQYVNQGNIQESLALLGRA